MNVTWGKIIWILEDVWVGKERRLEFYVTNVAAHFLFCMQHYNKEFRQCNSRINYPKCPFASNKRNLNLRVNWYEIIRMSKKWNLVYTKMFALLFCENSVQRRVTNYTYTQHNFPTIRRIITTGKFQTNSCVSLSH